MASTIKDVAKMADVSISTVSRVINESKPVSPEAKKRVLHAIEVLDYKPNEVARSLVTKKSNLIGVIVSDIGSNYVAQILRGVEEIGRMYNYDIILSSSYGDGQIEVKFAKLLLQKQVEGIIVISDTLNNKLLYKLEESKKPYIVLNRFYNIDEHYSVGINNKKATYDMTKYLIEKGHKNIACLIVRKDFDRTEEKYKVEGYKKALGENSLKENIIELNGIKENDIENEIENIVEKIKKEKLSALICSQDEIAIHVSNYLSDRGINVPKDVSVTAYGGSYITTIHRPKLTAVKVPYYDIGAVAIRSILKEIKGESDSENVMLPARILEGQSVKKF
ncbi:LacI family transcriptional regulator [Peptoniphilus koenoeneniae]|uniref:LacI family transcriptional regulator n=1 Tax=Peptoniphilus koenoeneniae TaxID=507751 RepID=A0ABU0AXF3_9FIRM|nr:MULTISPECIES: LacI family DNA-binding transcriptional regulator [Peptoniphilus]ERT57450.1 putative glucose-resistance amylase regulator [Peptoniphilus sp. BV3C26]MDQ0275467.1 LacI family transcriptional regulator [Peptoniphilus koenoeneniae]